MELMRAHKGIMLSTLILQDSKQKLLKKEQRLYDWRFESARAPTHPDPRKKRA